MVLTIKVTQVNGKTPESPIEAVFDEKGGSLGRSPKNHLVLIDKNNYISTKHADITYENGKFFYIDTSTNGSQIIKSSPDTPQNTITLKKKDKIELQNQDELQVGDYKLILNITGDERDAVAEPEEGVGSPKNNLSLTMFGFNHDENEGQPAPKKPGQKAGNNHVQPNMPFSLDSADTIDPFFPPEDMMESQSPVNGSREPSKIPIDLNYDDFFSQDKPKQKEPVKPVKKVAPPIADELPRKAKAPAPKAALPKKIKPEKVKKEAEGTEVPSDFLEIFLKAAGIKDTNAFSGKTDPELVRNLGMIFRELVDGLMMILRGRTELKSHLRLAMTTLKSSENNPLKFFPTVEEALIYFLKNNHPGYIDPTDAVQEGFEDIMGHQLALNAGVQASLASTLKRFDPTFIAKKFDEGFVLNKKARCWDEYKDVYPQLVEKALEDFFGEEFIRAYENQIQRLRTDPKQT